MPATWDPVEIGYDDLDVDDPEEQMGSKDKYWVRLPGDRRRWLMKIARIDERDGTVSGEDWAEWLVQHLAAQLGVPAARVRPARFEGQRAVVSRSVLRDDADQLIHGNELLSARFPEYNQAIRGENSGYTPQAVLDALAGVLAPAGASALTEFTAFDALAGYLLLDAWVAGRDRHHENWGIIRHGDMRRLAPSFDHGNALGFQERDERRLRMLHDDAHLLRWLERGTSQHFVGRPLLTDLAIDALALANADAREHWWSRLAALDEQAVVAIVRAVPDDVMSEVTRRFIICLLDVNRRRLLDGYRTSQS